LLPPPSLPSDLNEPVGVKRTSRFLTRRAAAAASLHTGGGLPEPAVHMPRTG